MSGKIVRTTNITQSAVGNKDGLWTTVFAAAVFINDDNLAIDTAKSVAVATQGSPQEDVMRQTLDGQLKNNEAPRQKEPAKSGVEQAKMLTSTRKSL
jgi:hypothetical protein